MIEMLATEQNGRRLASQTTHTSKWQNVLQIKGEFYRSTELIWWKMSHIYQISVIYLNEFNLPSHPNHAKKCVQSQIKNAFPCAIQLAVIISIDPKRIPFYEYIKNFFKTFFVSNESLVWDENKMASLYLCYNVLY